MPDEKEVFSKIDVINDYTTDTWDIEYGQFKRHPSFGLVGRVRIGADGLHRITVQDAPSVRQAVPRLRSQIVDVGLTRLDARFALERDIRHARATLWAEIVARGMDASDADSRDRGTILQLHAGGMGLLIELGWPNVFIIEESAMVFHFHRVEGSASEASQYVESRIRESINYAAVLLTRKRNG